ncbi:MAG: type II toxin-antitoxin system RelE/ParE family toxin [Anaerolineales bacterium]|nr:type II toxin-antitoxin system RelE/ParE family toxin [Anaerolineales bacterium]
MPYRLVFTASFDRDLKSLHRHNPTLRDDFESFIKTFDAQAHPVIPGTGGARKARMPAKGRGKRGGYRLIYYLVEGNTVWLITIYDKVQKENLSPAEEKIISQVIQKIRESSVG